MSLLLFTLFVGVLSVNSWPLLESSKRRRDYWKGCHDNAPDDYLNRRFFTLTNGEISYVSKQSSINSIDDSSPCRLHPLVKFKTEDVVQCLDSLSIKRNRRSMHFAFIGDSTVRQHFVSFLRLIPDNDRKMKGKSGKFPPYIFHEDRNVTSRLFDNLLVSFRWRFHIKQDLIADFKRWASPHSSDAPDFILIGVTAHHIRTNEISDGLEEYERLLKNKLLPLMEQSLAVHPDQEIIWLHQSPTIDYLGPGADRRYHEINVDKIDQYNRIIRNIFRNTRIVIWDAVSSVIEEYLRSCALTRVLRRDSVYHFNCDDFIHPGFGAISVATQLLINHICAAQFYSQHRAVFNSG